MVQNQCGRAVALSVNPLELRVQSMPRCPEEVHLRVVKSHPLRDVAVRLRQCSHQTRKERSIGDLIDDSWTRRQRAILDSQVWDSVSDSIAGSIPAPDSSVVQS